MCILRNQRWYQVIRGCCVISNKTLKKIFCVVGCIEATASSHEELRDVSDHGIDLSGIGRFSTLFFCVFLIVFHDMLLCKDSSQGVSQAIGETVALEISSESSSGGMLSLL